MIDGLAMALIVGLQIALYFKLSKMGAYIPKYETEEKISPKPFAKASKKRKPITNDDLKAYQKEQENV